MKPLLKQTGLFSGISLKKKGGYLNTEKLQKLRDFPWEEHYPKLIAFADHILQTKYWNVRVIPKGHTAETIVQDVIGKVFNEERNWEPERGPLFMYLKWSIKNYISHLTKSATNKYEIHSEKEDEDSNEEAFIEWVDKLPHNNSEFNSPEENLIDSETEFEQNAFARAKIDALLKAANGNPDLEEIVFAVIDGHCSFKPRELALFLNKSVEKINQSIRTLRRKAIKIRIEDQDEGK